MNTTPLNKAALNRSVPFALSALLLCAPVFAQDTPPATQTTDAEAQAQMKAEQDQQTPPPATDTSTTTDTTADTATTTTTETMTSNDASAAMQSTTGTAAAAATATGAGVTTAVLPSANVTVTSHPGDSISSNYHIDFASLDKNGDGNLSHGEVNASGNPDLMREFVAVDNNHNGRLSKDELKGWMD